jgi:ribonuclease E
MARPRRQYKIQEVIKRRQVMLVQVVKEERGTKGAALTTYLSLAGRYSVLMPNTARGGGISRKITNAEDRRRLKDIAQDLEVPEGMGVILRTAGAARTKTEVKRDFEYLLRLWETVRDLTLKSTAPKLVYEEGSLVKRSIRDLYNKDIDDIIVSGDDGYREAKDFMRMLMPSHAKNVKQYKEQQPLLTRYGIESQLDAMFSPIVQLRSGGYIVLNQTEALVSIDVNSGRATREHHIEDTALKTNVEAAEEIARQLRLRDLAGLIVIDFIDMDEKRNNRTVERKLKDSLKHDRARIQVGRISHFGLLEMSRQRIRSSVLESSTEKCPECGGTGHVRSVSSVALQLLRALEEMLIKSATHNLIARTRTQVALYVLNHKRAHLRALEERFQLSISVNADDSVNGPQSYVIDRGEQVHTPEAAKALVVQPDSIVPELEDQEEEPVEQAATASEEEPIEIPSSQQQQSEGNGRRRRRRRRRRRGGGESHDSAHAADQGGAPSLGDEGDEGDDGDGAEDVVAAADVAEAEAAGVVDERSGNEAELGASNGDGSNRSESQRRYRGRRGGRSRSRSRDDDRPRTDRSESVNGSVGDEIDAIAEASELETPAQHFEVRPVSIDAEAPMPRPPDDTSAQAPQSAPIAASTEAASESPRRRSTVREPAPVMDEQGAVPIPMPRPVPATPPTESDTDTVDSPPADESRPRRTGWWSRRA